MDFSPSLPHHRHQSSLEGVIDFSPTERLDQDTRAQALQRFEALVGHFEATNKGNKPYNRASLVRLTYEYARSEESRDNFLRAFFKAMALPMTGTDAGTDDVLGKETEDVLFNFADYLMNNFFIPMRASSKKTPQPSPKFYSAVQEAQGGGVQDFVGTPRRQAELRRDCLIRDHHRCVISRRYDYNYVISQTERVLGDDGEPLLEYQVDCLEVAHIIPFALTHVEQGSELDASKKAALDILNMFDRGVLHLIEGTDIDRPRNAITLTPRFHHHFSVFEVFFQALETPHTYRIDSFLHPDTVRGAFPVTRTLYQTEDRTIDLPSPRLLALHYAIAHILHLSGAGEYINKVLDNLDKGIVQSDGSTDLGRLVLIRMNIRV